MLYNVLQQQQRQYPDKIAVVGERRSLSYSELLAEVDNAALFLQSLGHAPGDAIVLGIPPSPEFFAAFYAAASLGLTVFPVLPSGKISPVIQQREPQTAIGDAEFILEVAARCPSIKRTVRWSPDSGLNIPRSNRRLVRDRIIRDERVIAVSSSGTTGVPTVYLRSAELLLRRAEVRSRVLEIGPDDVMLSSRPYNSGSGINDHVVLPIFSGCKIVVHEQFERFKAAEAIAREKVTVLYAVPFIFELLASIPTNHSFDFSSLRLCVSGGAPLSKYVAEEFTRRFGASVRQRYAGSHFHPAFLFNKDDVPGAVGRADGLFPVLIFDDHGQEVSRGTTGEIVFDCSKFPPAWRSFFEGNPNRKKFYLYTGDLGRIDAGGNVFVVGRKSPFVKVGGYRVEPAEVEDVLRSHPRVTDALVYRIRPGEPDEAVGADVVAEGVTAEDLLHYCAARLDGYKCPRKIELRSELPRSAHGKILRTGIDEPQPGPS